MNIYKDESIAAFHELASLLIGRACTAKEPDFRHFAHIGIVLVAGGFRVTNRQESIQALISHPYLVELCWFIKHNGAGIAPGPALLVCSILPESSLAGLERLHVGSLPSLGTLHYVELDGLTFLQTLETI